MFGIGGRKKKKVSLQSLVDKQQKAELKKFLAERKAKQKAEERKRKLEKMRSETELYRVQAKRARAKKRVPKRGVYLTVPKAEIPLLTTGLPKKKAQTKKLSRKSRIRLI